MALAATPSSTGDGSASSLALPSSITSMKSILGEEVEPRQLVNIIGLVKDFSPPVKTRGTDYKAKMWLYDLSLQDDEDNFEVSIFQREEDQFPRVGPGDVVYLQSTRVQRFRSDPLSCLSTLSTRIHVFKASQIPKPPAGAARALETPPGQSSALPTQQVFRFVSALYHSIDKNRIPDHETFTVAADQALRVKAKFQELSNIHSGTFFDLVVMVVKQPFEMGDSLTLWVTDYTENDAFYPMSEHGSSDGLYADPMGYTQQDNQGWKGPMGKMSLQVTCWEPHASVVRFRVTTGTYIRMRNVQVKFGRNGANLEGFLRGDPKYPGKVNIEVLYPSDDPYDMDPKLKGLLRRKRDYLRAKKRPDDAAIGEEEEESEKHKGEKKAPKDDNAATKEGESKKRKSENEAPKGKSKARRAKRRAHLQANEEPPQEDPKKMNPLVACEDMGVAPVPVSSIFEPVYLNISAPGGPVRVVLPFNNIKYRAIVRVVDFRPNTLEEFTYLRRPSEYGALSDRSESSDDEADPSDGSANWEWRFKLLLEDASAQAGPKPARVWAYVDNPWAQYLTSLDASDLTNDPQGMANLRSQMGKLWGNLEERKRKLAERESRRMETRGDLPADDSDEDVPQAVNNRNDAEPLEELANEPFSCCLMQYGVKTAEENPEKADAGEGRRWKRRYALSGTRIQDGCSD